MAVILRIHFYIFVLILLSFEGQSQNLQDTSFFNECYSVPVTSYNFWIKGKDTLRYFICSKSLTHYDIDKSPCYTADIIFPSLVKKKSDFISRALAIHLMNKYNLYEIRMFKTCRVRNLAWMSIRPPDPTESSKIDRDIKKNLKTFRKSVIVIE